MFGYATGAVVVRSRKTNGRSIYDVLMEGRITLSGLDEHGHQFQRIVEVHDGEVWDSTLKFNGVTAHRIAYGKFETIHHPEGREIIRFKKGTGKGKHGKSRRRESVFGHPGWCHSWYKNSRLVRQKFIYDNRRTAYDYNAYKNECIVKDPDGAILYEITGALQGVSNNALDGCHSVFSGRMEDWFRHSIPFEVKTYGQVKYSGEVKNNQKIGKWVIGGKTFYYQNGVAIPKKLFETPADKLDPAKILKIENAQLRMALMEKIGPDKIADIGKVIHKDGDMRLYAIPKYGVNILRVRCTTTKAYYFLRVPKDATKCEEARQWTFHVGQDIARPIKFSQET
jgi:hypothetical protein